MLHWSLVHLHTEIPSTANYFLLEVALLDFYVIYGFVLQHF